MSMFGRGFEGVEPFEISEVEKLKQILKKYSNDPRLFPVNKIKPETNISLQEAEEYFNNLFKK